MGNLRIGPLPKTDAVRVTVAVPGELHEALLQYARAVSEEEGRLVDIRRLIPRMLQRFIDGDREFSRRRRQTRSRLETGHT